MVVRGGGRLEVVVGDKVLEINGKCSIWLNITLYEEIKSLVKKKTKNQ